MALPPSYTMRSPANGHLTIWFLPLFINKSYSHFFAEYVFFTVKIFLMSRIEILKLWFEVSDDDDCAHSDGDVR